MVLFKTDWRNRIKHQPFGGMYSVPTVDSVGNFMYENKGDGSKALTVSFFTLL